MKYKYKEVLEELSRYKVGDIVKLDNISSYMGYLTTTHLVSSGYLIRGTRNNVVITRPINANVSTYALEKEAKTRNRYKGILDFWLNSKIEGLNKIIPAFYACYKFINNTNQAFRIKDITETCYGFSNSSIGMILTLFCDIGVLEKRKCEFIRTDKPIPEEIYRRRDLEYLSKKAKESKKVKPAKKKNAFLYERARKAGLI